MKTYNVNCDFLIEAEDDEDAYYKLLEYLADCVRDKDVTPFDFEVEEPVRD